MAAGSQADAGAVSLTVLQVNSEKEEDTVRDYSRRIIQEMAQMPGFISFLGAVAGDKMFTISVWENEDAPRALLRGGTHKEAMQKFFGADFTRGGVTSVFTPGRIGVQWARCESCGKMSDSRKREGLCECGAQLPTLTYW
jgi:heme-degrading monooxygenase HmoA